MKRLIQIATASLLGLTLLAGCGASTTNQPAAQPAASEEPSAPEQATDTKKIKVVSQMFYDPIQQQYIKENILPIFKEETGIDVELQVVANLSELTKTIEAQKSTGNWTTDVLIAHDSSGPILINEYDALKPYDWEPEGTFISQFDDNFVVDGNRYFVPLQADIYFLIANKKALPYLEELNYDINDLTWEQLAEWSNNIKAKDGNARYVFPALPGKFAAYEFNAIQLAYGDTYVPVFNTEASQKAFNLVASMKDSILPSSATIDFPTVSLSSEEAWLSVFHQAYAGTIYSQAPDKFVVAPVPKGDTGKRGTIAGGHGIGIVKESKNQEAAKAFIEFLLEDEILYEVMSETGPWIPSKKEVLTMLGEESSDVIMKMGIETLDSDVATERVRSGEYEDWGLVKKLYEETFVDIMGGKAMDQAYLDAKQAELESMKH